LDPRVITGRDHHRNFAGIRSGIESSHRLCVSARFLLAYHFRKISSKSPDRFSISSKRAIASAAKHPQPALWQLGGSLMEVPMRKVTRFGFLLLTAVTLGLLAAIPLVAAWRMPAGQCVAPVPLKPREQAVMPLIAGQCAIAESALKQPELIADPVWLDW
jgi:hypothetical protein